MKTRLELIRELVKDCIVTHNEEVIINLLYNLEKEYKELASLSTLGEYNDNWTHTQLLNYITKEF